MKHIVALSLLALTATPVLAQEVPPPALPENSAKISEGSRLLLEGLMGELGPLFDDMAQFGADLGAEIAPFVDTLRNQLGDAFEGLNAYHPPEILPNGDIILRKKVVPDDLSPPQGPIDL
jgi:hypothetical protein